MSEYIIETEDAIDAIDQITQAVKGCESILRTVEKAKKLGKEFDRHRAEFIVEQLLGDIIEAGTYLSQGDGDDRLSVSRRVAKALVAGRHPKPKLVKAGTKVRCKGGSGVYTVVEWQPHNGIGGSYWLRDSQGGNVVAGPREVVPVSTSKKGR